MKSVNVCYSDREINYENIPTQQNEQSSKNKKTLKYKENKINSRKINNLIKSINVPTSGINSIQKDTLNNNNKLVRNNNIKIIPKKIQSNNINYFKHNKSKSININHKIIQRNNISKLTTQNQAFTQNKNPKNKVTRKKHSLKGKINNKLIKNEVDSTIRQAKYTTQKNNKKNIPKTPEAKKNKSTKEIFSMNSSNKKTKDYFSSISSRNINNASFFSGLSYAKSMTEIENTINKLYEWDKRRKEKIENLRNLKDKKIDKYTYIPKINKRSNSLAAKRKLNNEQNENIFERLSKEDPLIKEKKKILIDLSTPTFQPRICLSSRNTFHRKKQRSIEKKENNGKFVIKVNRINPRLRKEKFDINEDKKLGEDDIMQNLLRKTIIKNINNKFINKNDLKIKI